MSGLPTGALTVQMVAARWGTSDTFVYDQIKSGRLSAFKLGNKLIRIKPEAVDQYEQNGAVESAQSDFSNPAGEVPVGTDRVSAASLGRLARGRSSTR